jgi:DNA polymerase I-like protein with 3'-5' exonuclease and polymerase domains
MDIITLDFETFYSKDFGFKKLTTEQYVRSPDFEEILIGIKRNSEETIWISGEHGDLKQYLRKHYDWANSALLAHNTLFDGAVLAWRFGIHPKMYLDTLCMARAIHGVEAGGSLAALAEAYGIGTKGDEVVRAEGKRRADFSAEELSVYANYCMNDVNLTYALFDIFINKHKFPHKELKVIDLTLRMFIDPMLVLDVAKLSDHLDALKDRKENLLNECGISKDDLMSNPKLAEVLRGMDVVPPTKISARTGKETFAFAKTDEGFKALQDHEDTRVQMLVTARLGVKSTLEETRTERFIDIATRGKTMPVPIKYYAAHTGRWGGYDKINLQNLPSRGKDAKVLKQCIVAPEGYTIIQADSAQIEARVLAWLAEQNDLLAAFTRGEDVYKQMAAKIYGIPISEVTDAYRFIGKSTILGAGFGMGAVRFREQLKGFGVAISVEESQHIIRAYRDAHPAITLLWRNAQTALQGLYCGEEYTLGRAGVVRMVPEEKAIRMPSGLLIRYPELKAKVSEDSLTPEFSYKTRKGWERIYGGKIIENLTQGIARCVIADQMLEISKRYRVLLTVHDSVVCCVRDEEVDAAANYIDACMRYVPDWAKHLPVRGDVEVGKSYGACVKWKPKPQAGHSAA